MRRKIMGCIVVLSFGALMTGGCAKKDMVRAEEPISAVQQAPPPAAPEVVRPAPQVEEPARPESLRPETITETPALEGRVQEESAREGMPATQLQTDLQQIYFNFDSATLSDESRSVLTRNAEFLARQASVKVSIEGHCDERGSDDYNMALGERRAKAARDYLVNLGVQPERLSFISYGEEKPADPEHGEAAWAKNRRAEFVIVK